MVCGCACRCYFLDVVFGIVISAISQPLDASSKVRDSIREPLLLRTNCKQPGLHCRYRLDLGISMTWTRWAPAAGNTGAASSWSLLMMR